MIRTAYLRVYQPVTAFSAEDRRRWESRLVEAADDPSTPSLGWLKSPDLAIGQRLATAPDGAFTRRIDDQIYYCPWRTRLRILAGMLAFRGSVPAEVADAFIPEVAATRAQAELAALDATQPGLRSHILHANWHVPLRWFAAFDDSERILVEDRSGLRLRYETGLYTAAERLNTAIEVLETALVDDGVAQAVGELNAWIQGFDSDGLLELDYGAVARTFSDEEILEDRSASEVSMCLEALREGDGATAARAFARLSERWSDVRAHEVMN